MSYMGTHNTMRRVKGSAREFACRCGRPAQEWAYNNASTSELVDELGRRYSRNPNDYTALCYHCHRIEDKSAVTHCPQGHEYAGENLLMDAGKRKCKTCVYARNRARRVSPAQKARKAELQRTRRSMTRAVA